MAAGGCGAVSGAEAAVANEIRSKTGSECFRLRVVVVVGRFALRGRVEMVEVVGTVGPGGVGCCCLVRFRGGCLSLAPC